MSILLYAITHHDRAVSALLPLEVAPITVIDPLVETILIKLVLKNCGTSSRQS